jgi:hypothetical protein
VWSAFAAHLSPIDVEQIGLKHCVAAKRLHQENVVLGDYSNSVAMHPPSSQCRPKAAPTVRLFPIHMAAETTGSLNAVVAEVSVAASGPQLSLNPQSQ